MKLVRGLTMLEILVVVAIVAVLAAFLYPAIQRTREQGKVAVTQQRLHQIGVALLLYREQCDAKDAGSPSQMGSPIGGLPPNDLPAVLRLPQDIFKCASPKRSTVNPLYSSQAYKCMSCSGMVSEEYRADFDKSWAHLSSTYGTQLPFVVMMCHSDPNTSRSSPLSTHYGLGVNFAGHIVKKSAKGYWQDPDWWAK